MGLGWKSLWASILRALLSGANKPLSSQPTPYQVLKLNNQKLHKDNSDESTKDCRFLGITFTFKPPVKNLISGHHQGDVVALDKSLPQELAPVAILSQSCGN